MAINKVVLSNGRTLLDVSSDTVTAEHLEKGYTAHNSAGESITGTMASSGAGVDTSDATVTAAKMVKGYTAYAKGTKVTGTLDYSSYTGDFNRVTGGSTAVNVVCTPPSGKDILLGDGNSSVTVNVHNSNFGNATAADVAKGKTFTSSAGFKVEGTASSSGGIDTSDATATASDLPYGVTAYAKGTKITGSINQIKSGSSNALEDTTPSVSNNNLRLNYQRDKDIIMRSGSWQIIDCALSNLGDATAADVAKGKTFTSSAGLKVTGTASTGSGGTGLPDIITAGDTPIWSKTCNVSTRSDDSINTNPLFSGSSVMFTAPKTGTYRFKFTGWTDTTSGTKYARAYLSTESNMLSSPSGSIWWKDLPLSNATDLTVYIDVTLTEGQRIFFFGKTADGIAYGVPGPNGKIYNIQVCINWDNGTNQG